MPKTECQTEHIIIRITLKIKAKTNNYIWKIKCFIIIKLTENKLKIKKN